MLRCAVVAEASLGLELLLAVLALEGSCSS